MTPIALGCNLNPIAIWVSPNRETNFSLTTHSVSLAVSRVPLSSETPAFTLIRLQMV